MLLPAEEAIRQIQQHCQTSGTSEFAIEDKNIYGTVCAENVFADRNIPPFNRAAVDGFAIRYQDIEKGIKTFTIIGTLTAGSDQVFHPGEGECVHVMTGAPVPSPADIMYKIEETETDGQTTTIPEEKYNRFMNIAREGEDSKAGDLLVPQGTRIDSSVLPVLAGVGKFNIKTHKRPEVTLITTGDEIIPVTQTPLPWQIRDSSSFSLRQLLFHYGITLKERVLIKDNREELTAAIKQGLASDILLLTGGVSMGTTDIIPDILSGLGVEKVFHKLKIKPGKPLWFGKTKTAAVFGLPGNPVSSQVGLKIFVEPYIRKFMGLAEQKTIWLPLAQDKTKKHDLTEFTQGKIISKDNKSYLQPIKHHGSGDYVHLLSTDGLMVHPAEELTLKAGQYLQFYPWRSL